MRKAFFCLLTPCLLATVAFAELGPAAGDLVFFGRNQRVNHVGIYLGDGRFIHAPRTRKTIRISSLEEFSYLRLFLGARRLWFDH